MKTIHYNFKQFQENWYTYEDNVKYFEALSEGRGEVNTLDARPYIQWLTDFNIFFTADGCKPEDFVRI